MITFVTYTMKKYLYILLMFGFGIGFANTNLPIIDIDGNTPITLTQDKERVMLTPNPATTFTQIKLAAEDAKIVEVNVYSLLGNKLFSQAYAGNEKSIQLNVQNFKRGKYLVKVNFADGTSEVKALIKQ